MTDSLLDKALLREQVMTLPINAVYPYDPELKIIRALGLRSPGMLDIGANAGIYSAVLEDVAGDKLYLFEPLPNLYDTLRKNFSPDHVFNLALSDCGGRASIRVPIIDGYRYETRATLNTHREPGESGFDEVSVELARLDSVVNYLQLQTLGFIKMDVEGHELEVINGGLETLQRFKPLLLVEIEARHHSFPISVIFEKLQSLEYEGFYFNPQDFHFNPIVNFDDARDQNETNLISRQFSKYLNNFFFVNACESENFLLRVKHFLSAEKLLLEGNLRELPR